MRHGEGDDLRHRRMIHQHLVDLERRDLLAAAIDDLLQPAGDAQIAVLVEHALVAGVEPAMGEGRGVGVGVVLVARRHVRSANDDLAGLARFQQLPVRRHDRDLRSGRSADAAGLAQAGRQAVRRHLVRGFRHAVGFDDRAAESRFELGHHLWRQRCRRRADEAQRGRGQRLRDCAPRAPESPDAWSARPCTRSAWRRRASGRSAAH